MREHSIFACLSVVVVAVVVAVSTAAVDGNAGSKGASGGPPVTLSELLQANNNNNNKTRGTVAAGAQNQDATTPAATGPSYSDYYITDRGIYMSGPAVNETGNTVLTVGYLTAIKGDLKDKQGLAISGAITIAIDEVSEFIDWYEKGVNYSDLYGPIEDQQQSGHSAECYAGPALE